MTPSELSLLEPEERRLWEINKDDPYSHTRALLSKVARLRQAEGELSELRIQLKLMRAERDGQSAERKAAESRISTLTLEKDSALQLRDRYKERVGELEARLRWALGHLPKFVTMTEDGSAYIRGTGAGGTELAGFSAEFHRAEAALKGESHGGQED